MSEVTTWYLQMLKKDDFKAKFLTDRRLTVTEVKIKDFRYNRFLYTLVGELWHWLDKLNWSEDDWRQYAENDRLETWVAYYEGTPAGYYELLWQPEEQAAKIEYFGLSPKFIGKGIGGHLLSHAIDRAWKSEIKRLWVHTCSNDHPSALKNYEARGFQVYDIKKG
ncbi:MAG: GNAT family N-acetyltransferase [Cyclobacteriaceae bacterium]